MNLRDLSLAFLYGFALFAAACAPGPRQPLLEPGEITVPRVLHLLRGNYQRLQTLKGRARLIIESPGGSYSASSTVALKKPDSIFIKVEATFGIDVGWLFADRQRFVLYAPFQNRCITGVSDSLKLGRFLAVDMTFDRFMQALAGIELAQELTEKELRLDGSAILLSGAAGQLQQRIWIDPYWGAATRVEIRDSQNRLVSLAEYGQFVRSNGVRLPRKIRLQRPLDKASLTLFYQRLQANEKLKRKDFPVAVPENAERIEI